MGHATRRRPSQGIGRAWPLGHRFSRKARQARRLFAGAIETPGGLKIQTIHAFCSSILRRFPLEAGISPRFAEMDERTAFLLRQDVIEHMAEGAEASLVQDIVRYIGGDDGLDKLANEICGHAESLSPACQTRKSLRSLICQMGMTKARSWRRYSQGPRLI